jgi:hypothetical protein
MDCGDLASRGVGTWHARETCGWGSCERERGGGKKKGQVLVRWRMKWRCSALLRRLLFQARYKLKSKY